MSKKLSIIVPFYKGEAFIGKTVCRILEKQKYEPKEIIIVDDGSPDLMNGFLEKMREIDTCIKVFHKENGGVADARNYGIDIAEGEFIAFFDQDDDADKNMYSELIEAMENNDFVSSNFYAVSRGRSFEQKIITRDVPCIGGQELSLLRKQKAYGKLMDVSDYKFPSTVWNCIFKRSVITENSIKFHANVDCDDDYNFLLDYLSFCGKITLCQKAYYRWNVRADSESHRKKYIENYYEKLKKQYLFKINSFKNVSEEKQEKRMFAIMYWAESLYKVLDNEKSSEEVKSSKEIAVLIKMIIKKEQIKYKWCCFNMLWKVKGRKHAAVYWLCTHKLTPIAIQLFA